jgi:hypothetical protein
MAQKVKTFWAIFLFAGRAGLYNISLCQMAKLRYNACLGRL